VRRLLADDCCPSCGCACPLTAGSVPFNGATEQVSRSTVNNKIATGNNKCDGHGFTGRPPPGPYI
jgi:hypothetical protein